MGKIRYAYKILVGIPEGKKFLGRPRCMSNYTIKVNVKKLDMTFWAIFIYLRIRSNEIVF